MISASVGDECFVKCRGRVFRAVVRYVTDPQGPFRPSIQVFTEAAKLYSVKWHHISFWQDDLTGLIDKDARLIVPETIAELTRLGDAADAKHYEPERKMAAEPPRPAPRAACPLCDGTTEKHAPLCMNNPRGPEARHVSLPYADDDDERRVMHPPAVERPEGWEPEEE